MSGPKTSVLSPNFVYYNALTEHAKAEWAEKEILISLQSMQSSERAIATLITKIQALQDDECPDARVQSLIETARQYMDVTFDDIDDSHDFTASELRGMKKEGAEDVSWYRKETLETVRLEGKYLEYYQSIRDKSFQQKTNIARACAAKAAKMKTQVRKLELAYWDLSESMKEEVFQEGIRTSFYIPFKSIRNRAGAEDIIKKINEALFGVSSMILTDSMLEQLRSLKEKAAEIKDGSYLSNFYQLVIRPFVEECTQYDAFYNAHFAEYEEYKTSYEILCSELNLVPQEMEISAESIAFYKAKTLELQGILLQRHTRETVMETVNEVMTEMGYDLVATRDVVKKSGKQYHDELYLYGDGTAISVVQSSEGQLTMEIGGLDYGDRMPTEEEAKNMESLMVSFCLDYQAIAEALVKKGLDMKKVSLLPPDAQYATIINLDDYEVSGSVETITEAKKEERRAEDTKKERHAED